MTAYRLAELGTRFDLPVQGDGDTRIDGVCTLAPGEPGRLSFLANPQYRAQLAATRASAVVVSARDAAALTVPGLIARDPYLAYARIAALFDHSRQFTPGIHPTAVVDASVRIGAGVFVGAHCVIESGVDIGTGSYIGPGSLLARDCRVGADSRLEARVVVSTGVCIGARALVQPGAVIGSRGFGNARLPDGRWQEVPQLGGVVIGDDVEIGANTTIDRGALGDTVIEDGVKLDNQIQIAHNVHIGAHTAIAACTGIAGSTRVGKRCMIGGAVGISGHLQIADDVVILGRAMVVGHIPQAGVYGAGLPAMPAREWRKAVARVRRLDQLNDRVRHLEKQLSVTAVHDSDNETPA